MQNSIDKHGKKLYNHDMSMIALFEHIQINSCGISDCDADWHWDTGKSGFTDFDFWLVVRGKGQIAAADEVLEVSEGACLVLLPHIHYEGTNDPNRPLMTLNVHFSLPEAQSRTLCTASTPFLHRNIPDHGYLQETLRRVIRLYNADRQQVAEGVFFAALTEFFTQPVDDTRPEFDAEKTGLMQKICDRINASPKNAPSLSGFAAEYGYSADYLGRLFSKIIGISFSEYTANARINRARFLLASTDLPLDVIAENLGYYDVCYFSRQFRRLTGTSPGKYRNNCS